MKPEKDSAQYLNRRRIIRKLQLIDLQINAKQ